MIRQFAAEYTSQTSSPQDSCSDSQPCSDQSLPTPPLLSGAPPSTSPSATLAGLSHNQNPVLSKLLMADQDAPLDLTIKKPLPEPSEQDGVLDLSLKKNRSSSNLSVRSPCLSPATSTLKGESPDLHDAKAKDLQSTSTLEQFMAKLCPHHQRQIVDAIGFLQTEVKALTASNTHQVSNSTSGIQEDVCSTAKSTAVTPEKSCPEQSFPSESTPKPELQDISRSGPSSCAMQNTPENAVSLKTSVSADPALDLCSPGSESNHGSVTPTTNPVDTENRHSDHAPLRMKIMTSSVADGKKLSCVLNASFSPHSDICDDRQGNSNSSNRTETHSARLSSSIKRHSQASHTHQARQKETLEHSKDTPEKLFSVHMTIPSDSPRTARKTIRTSSDHRTRDSACRGIADPDLGHCDIVFIDKPITECYKEQHRSMLRRRNARKSTRGHMYSDEIWELKTVRTLAGKGNCPNPMPELITLITPKQILSKPEGVPPVDMPFVGPCREINQQMSTEESDESVIPGTGDVVEVAASEVDVIVETSQTGQSQSQSPPPSLRSPKENTETDMNTNVEQDTTADSGAAGSEEGVAQALFEAEKYNEPETQEDIQESTEQIVAEIGVEILEKITIEESEPQNSSDKLQNSEPALQQNSPPSPVNTFEDETQENQREEMQDEQTQERQPEKQIHYNNFEATETSNTTVSADEPMVKGTEVKTSEAVDSLMPLEHEDNEYDVSSKTLDALLKELPPWRRKRGTVILLPKRLRQTKAVIVGYVNGRPISASDRSLRRRSSNSTTSPTKISAISSQNVPNKNPLDSTVENKHLDKPLPETYIPTKPIPTTTVIEQVTEPSSDVALTTIRKVSSRVKQIQKQKRVQRDQDSLPVLSDHTQSPESTRLLRSASLKSAGSTVSQPTSNAVTDSFPKPADTHALPSTEQNPSITLPTSFPDTSPLIMSSPPAAFEQYQQSVPETSAGLNIEKSSQVEMTSEEIQKNEADNTLQAKQKLRSAKAVTDSKYENQQLSAEVSSPLENQSPVKTEMQTKIMPLRRKRVLRKEVEASNIALPQKPNVASLEDGSASGDDSSTSISDKPTRMPLRSESSKAEVLHQPVTQSPPVDSKKLALRSQRLAAPSTSAVTVSGRQSDIASPLRKPERITKATVKPDPLSVESVFTQSSHIPVITPRPEPPKQTVNKFFETLTGEESQHLISNLNLKYEKMQKGWVQMDKEGQPTTRYKSKADRQAAIWKSKRRTRKTKSSEHQKYSPVQMLFMKGFNLSSICRWFLESTETKSLVIVKKVNTRLPSETQLCFHSSSSSSGTSQGVFPSLQAERLKKHLKKFAIASPVKSNPKSQKLIAKALGQEANAVKGKERRELSSTTQTLPKSHSSAHACIPIGESQKSSGKSKNPASARILRKYSNIREKMQGQQTNVRMKKASKTLKTNNIKRLASTKAAAKSNLKPSLKAQKPALSVSKRMKEAAAKMVRRKTLAGKKTRRHLVQERAVKAQSRGRASRDATKKELPKRYSQRLGSPKVSEYNPVDTSKSKVDNKKQIEVEKVEVEKSAVNKMNAKPQTKESPQSTLFELKGNENVIEIPQQSMDVKFPTSLDQVLTRSQRKMETTVPFSGSPSHVPKRASKSTTTQNASPKSVRKAEEATLTRSGALKSSAKRSRTALLPRGATKSAKKRAQELLETPAKRTRTSLSK
ncbi:uncharacterized protein LOC113131648 isoform X2 [Mastacembelus armatus]|nr:uncharacterized protein LOC113131648 isoform X2 [Mastacembelus armatus]